MSLSLSISNDVSYDKRIASAVSNPGVAIVFCDLYRTYKMCETSKCFFTHSNKDGRWFSYTPSQCKTNTGLSSFKHSAAIRELQDMGVLDYDHFGKPRMHIVTLLKDGIKVNFPFLEVWDE